MFKKLALTAICALAAGSTIAKPGESSSTPLMLTTSASISASWNPDGEWVWTFADWLHIKNLTVLYVEAATTTTFDFGITPPNGGKVQEFDFDFLIDGASQTKTKPTGFAAYWDDVTLTGGVVYEFKLDSLNAHDNNTNVDFKVMAGTANTPTQPGPDTPAQGVVPEPASLALLGAGILALGMARRRRKQ